MKTLSSTKLMLDQSDKTIRLFIIIKTHIIYYYYTILLDI